MERLLEPGTGMKASLLKLFKAARTALAEVTTIEGQLAKQKEAAAAAAEAAESADKGTTGGKKGRGRPSAEAIGIFKLGQKVGKPMPKMAIPPLNLDMVDTPFVVQKPEFLKPPVDNGHAARIDNTTFFNVWSNHKMRQAKGRASRQTYDPKAASRTSALILDNVRGALRLEPRPDSAESVETVGTGACHYAATQGGESTNYKVDHLASLRVAFSGVRQVILFKDSETRSFMSDRAGAKEVTLPLMDSFLKALTLDSLQLFSASSDVYYAFVASFDMIYTPVGWLVAEIVGPSADVVGLRCTILLPSSAALKHLDALLESKLINEVKTIIDAGLKVGGSKGNVPARASPIRQEQAPTNTEQPAATETETGKLQDKCTVGDQSDIRGCRFTVEKERSS